MNATARKIAATLKAANVSARVLTDRFGSITVDTDNDIAARDALGLARFRDQIDGVEVTIV